MPVWVRNSGKGNGWDLLLGAAMAGAVVGLFPLLSYRAQYETAAQAAAIAPDFHADCNNAGIAGYNGATLDDACVWESALATSDALPSDVNGNWPGYSVSLDIPGRNDAMASAVVPEAIPNIHRCYALIWQDQVRMIEASGRGYPTTDNPDWAAKPAADLRQTTIGYLIGVVVCAIVAAIFTLSPAKELRGTVQDRKIHPERYDWGNAENYKFWKQ